MAKCLWREKYGGCGEVVNTADCGSVTRGFESHHSPHFFLHEIRYYRTSWGHRQAVRQRTLTPLSVVRLYLPLPENRNEPEDFFAKKISSGSFFYAFHIDIFLCKKQFMHCELYNHTIIEFFWLFHFSIGCDTINTINMEKSLSRWEALRKMRGVNALWEWAWLGWFMSCPRHEAAR